MDSDSETEQHQIVESGEGNKSINDDNSEDDYELFSKSKTKKKKRGNILDSDEENEPLSNNKQSQSSDSDSDAKENAKVKKLTSSKKRIIKTFDSDSDEASNSPKKSDKASNKSNKASSKSSDDSDSQKSDSNDRDDSDSKENSNVKKLTSSKKRIVKTFDSDSDEASNSPNKSEKASNKSDKASNKSDKASNKSSDDSDGQKSDSNDRDVTNHTPSARIKERNYKFENKFKSMLKKVNKLPDKSNNEQTNEKIVEKKIISNDLYDSESEDDENDNQNKMDIEDERKIEYDEMEHENLKSKKNKVKPQLDQPKVQRMSAKQAMEQMHKIKSESGRMLREKQVSLPYHKPKQMSLKDILAKRKNASTSLNSRFGFKMNSDQLKEYVKELENREKEILELCKSESEEEEEEENENCDNKDGEEETKTNSDKKNDEKTAEEKNKEFVSLQNACKNLLDMFDKNDTSNEPNNEAMNIVENISDNLENADKNVLHDKETDASDAIESNEEANQKSSEVNADENNGKVIADENDGKVIDDENDDKVNHLANDNIETTEEPDVLENAPVLEVDDAKNITEEEIEVPAIEVLKENDPGIEKLPESEQLFEDSEMDCDFTIDKDLQNITPSQSEDTAEHTQLTADLVIKQNPKPRLTGSPGCFIDLISGEVNSGVELLKKKFLYHSAIKTPEELEREKERKIHPGSALSKLKRDLENKIIENRTQEWTKRLEDLALKKKEESDNLSDCEELLEKEECSKMLDNENQNDDTEMKSDAESCEEEEEPIENDVDLTKEKKRKKCDLLDEEADVDDEENIVSADEKETDNDDSDDSDSSDDSGDDLTTNTETKKTLTRIIKPCDDSDSEEETVTDAVISTNENADNSFKQSNNDSDVFEDAKTDEYLTTPVKETKLKRADNSDLFDSQSESRNNSFSCEWDELPLGQKIVQSGMTPTPKFNKNISDTKLTNSTSNTSGRSDLASLVSPVIKLAPLPRTSSDNVQGDEFTSSHKHNFEYDEKIMNLQKKLLFDSEGSQCTQNLQDLESLCSGKFPSQDVEMTSSETSSKPANLDKLIDQDTNLTNETNQLTQDTENELLELCTGKFVGINDTQSMNTILVDDSQSIVLSLSETENTEKLNEYMENILNAGKNTDTENINDDNKERTKISDSVECNEPDDDILKSDKNVPEITVCNRGGKMAILSSEDEDVEGETGGKEKSKVLKSAKDRNKKFKKKIHLQFSDDESDQEEEDVISGDEYAESDEEKVVDYDSEENEIEVKPLPTNVKPGEKKKTSEFFDQEAELTSEDEWVGSGDEDERGLDRLEWEEGDADQFDQREVKKQLERIHLRTILDDDKREVRMLQEILLEDDMEGGTRERKFRWANVDSSVEPGATIGEEDIDTQGLDDMQTEEEWRKQRHERETYLRQLLEKENTIEQFSQNSESGSVIMTTKFVRQSSILVARGSGEFEDKNPEKDSLLKNKKGNKELPSPVKKPFSLLKNNIRGSFLSRGQAALNRLAMLTKNAPQPQEEGELTNLSSLAPGKKKNFVFATVSPPCDKNQLTEEVKILKRKAASEISTPLLIKKTKLIEQKIITSRKSLIDHID